LKSVDGMQDIDAVSASLFEILDQRKEGLKISAYPVDFAVQITTIRDLHQTGSIHFRPKV
jgi:hypothetical protein